MPENKYAVQPDLLKLLNLLDEHLQDEEDRAKKELVAMSDPAYPALLVFAERARKGLETVTEQRLEVALLKWQAEREAERKLEKPPLWRVMPVMYDANKEPLI